MVITGLEAKDGVALREIEITLWPGARFSLFALVHGAPYARLGIKVELMEGAHFELGGVILGSGDQTLKIVSDVHHAAPDATSRSEEHTSELQSLMRISYAVFCLKK